MTMSTTLKAVIADKSAARVWMKKSMTASIVYAMPSRTTSQYILRALFIVRQATVPLTFPYPT